MRRSAPMTGPLIVGAGPAGCAAAIALARGGAVPVLLDRDAEVGDPLCGGFLSWRTAARLRTLGVDPAALGAQRVGRLALFAGGRTAEIALPQAAFGLSRHALDRALRQRALSAGARLEVDHARGIADGEVIGRSRRWSGDGVFLATGKHDVRGLARERAAGDLALGLRLRLPPNAARTRLLAGRIELHLFAGGYAGIVLQEDGSANVCMALRKSRLAGDPRRLLDQLADRNPALAERLGADWRAAPHEAIGAVPYGFLAHTTEPGLFRLGDQAAVIPSLAGEGIAIALASGALAAEHWLAGGAAAAPAFQREFARQARSPLRIARAAWALAETPGLAAPAVALAGHVPRLVRALMHLTRIDPAASLARGRAAS
ncbi:MAG: hypothetical protein B7Z33_11390 [Sphingomonadales bacterium 12-68-11]|nr:MAG: hypothetical protein B7Z33_11390 [Sphingomonadales bacterium 12-68-11]